MGVAAIRTAAGKLCRPATLQNWSVSTARSIEEGCDGSMTAVLNSYEFFDCERLGMWKLREKMLACAGDAIGRASREFGCYPVVLTNLAVTRF
jgi:hypothetical protein